MAFSVEAECGTSVSNDVPDLLVGAALPRAATADTASGHEIGELALNACGIVNSGDFDSAMMRQHETDARWSAVIRTQVEDELTRNSTTMLRAPEILDNYPKKASIDTASGVWMLGCILYIHYALIDTNLKTRQKLKSIDGNYTIPPANRDFVIFHELIIRESFFPFAWFLSADQSVRSSKCHSRRRGAVALIRTRVRYHHLTFEHRPRFKFH